MGKRSKREKNEAKILVQSLYRDSVTIHGDIATHIFLKIMEEIETTEISRHFRELNDPEIPQEKPFIKGEQIGEGLPDIIYDADAFVLGIEHFEFDASKNNRFGSKMRIANDKTKEEMEKRIIEMRECDSINETFFVDVNFSYQQYVNSLLKSFENHANKIERYKNKLKEYFPNKKIYFSFLIEDVTKLGNYMITKDCTEQMNPLRVKEFLFSLKKYSGYDFIITKSQEMYVPFIHIEEISIMTIDTLIRNSYDLSIDRYWPYHYKEVLC